MAGAVLVVAVDAALGAILGWGGLRAAALQICNLPAGRQP